MATRSRRPRTAQPHDRDASTLRPRRELFEALFAYAVFLSARRRRRKQLKPRPLNAAADAGEIWFKGNQVKVIERYMAHVAYLRLDVRLSLRTLSRQIRGLRRLRRLVVGNYSRFDRQRWTWHQEPNVYTITRAGVLWIKRHARALKIPRFV